MMSFAQNCQLSYTHFLTSVVPAAIRAAGRKYSRSLPNDRLSPMHGQSYLCDQISAPDARKNQPPIAQLSGSDFLRPECERDTGGGESLVQGWCVEIYLWQDVGPVCWRGGH